MQAVWPSCSIDRSSSVSWTLQHPQPSRCIIDHLDPRRASLVLENLSEEHKVVSIQRLAECAVSPEIAQEVMASHSASPSGEHGRYSSPRAAQVQGGRRSSTACSMPSSRGRRCSEPWRKAHPELVLDIRDLMFTLKMITVPPARPSARSFPSGRRHGVGAAPGQSGPARAGLRGDQLPSRRC